MKRTTNDWCGNSRVWLAFKGYQRPSTCASPKDYEQHACRTCPYFKTKVMGLYALRKMIALGIKDEEGE